jgi:squalene-hopene/tetraprenyl-beta-curcumene cyclase
MCVLRGLDALGFDNHEAMVQQAAEWIRMMQNPDGGWGESCDSYDDPNKQRNSVQALARKPPGLCSG